MLVHSAFALATGKRRTANAAVYAWCRIFFLVPVFLLASCLDSREEITLRNDGSVLVELRCEFPENALPLAGGEQAIHQTISQITKTNPEVSSLHHSLKHHGDRVILEISAQITDLRKLRKKPTSTAPSWFSKFLGKTHTSRSGRTFSFTRIVDWSAILPGAAFLPAGKWRNHQTVTTLHLPTPAAHHNATRTENSGLTLIWETPMASAVKKPVVMSFDTRPPLSWLVLTFLRDHWLPLTIALGLLIAAPILIRKLIPRR